MHFYVPFHFFKLPFDFVCRPKAAYCEAKVRRGTPKGGKMSVPFFLNQMAFFHKFLRAISFFQSFSILLSLQKQHFASLKHIRVPQKEEKNSLLFFSNQTAFFHDFYVPFHFFKVTFDFSAVPKPAFCKAKVLKGTPKGAKMSFLFSLIEWQFFLCIFMCHFIFLKSLSIFPQFQNQHFARLKCIGVPPKEQKCHFFFSLIKWHFFMYFYVKFHLYRGMTLRNANSA